MANANLGKVALAMLGLLAFQNRDKIGDFLRNKEGADPKEGTDPQGGGGMLDELSKGVSGTALGDILDRFRGAGAGDKVETWVRPGPNTPVSRDEVLAALDDETLEELAQRTGMPKEELIDRITRDLPEAVDKMTPGGKLPEPTADPANPTLLDALPPSNR